MANRGKYIIGIRLLLLKQYLEDYASRKQAIVTIEVDADGFIYGTKEEKLALLTGEVKAKMDLLRQRLLKKNIYVDDLFQKIDEALH